MRSNYLAHIDDNAVVWFFRKEMAEAQRTNKPSGKCQFCLMISKTCKPAKKSISGQAQPKEELRFVNDEEEFFYEVVNMKA